MAGRDDTYAPSAAESLVFDNFGEDLGSQQEVESQEQQEVEEEGDDGLPEALQDAGDEGEDDDEGSARDNVLRMPQREGRQLDNLRQERVTHTPRPLPRGAEVRADKRGNLVDVRTGNIVATAGRQARFYKNMRKEQQKSAEYAQQVQDVSGRLQKAVNIGREMHGELTQLKAQNQRMREFGFEPEDQLHALQLYSDLRKDAGGTVKKLLTRLATQGITIEGLSGNAGVDPKALVQQITAEVRREMSPLRERTQAENRAMEARQREEQGVASAREEVSSFLRRNPDARRYIPTFQRLLQDPRNAEMSLGEMYLHILRADRNRQSPSTRQQTPQAGSNPPRGRRAPPSGDRGAPMASLDQSWDKIIGDVLDESGFQRAV